MPLIPWLRWQSFVDFFVLSAALYFLLLWAREARALRFAVVIVGLHIGALCARHFDLAITSLVLNGASVAVIGMVLLLFQSELRRSLLRLDSFVRFRFHPSVGTEAQAAIARAVFELARLRVGALIVLTRRNPIGGLVSKGVKIDAEVSRELLEATFLKDSPIHDGAIVIERNRIVAAGVVLPLTEREDIRADFGTRHRAAIGLAERCDAAVLVVSEERGEVVLIDGGRVTPVPAISALVQILKGLAPARSRSIQARLRASLSANWGFRAAAVGLAAVLWGLSLLASNIIVKNIAVPVEFSNVPPSLYILNQPARTVNVQLRGNRWVMDPAILRLAANLDLSGADEGVHSVPLSAEALRLPPGVVAERISPPFVAVRLARKNPR